MHQSGGKAEWRRTGGHGGGSQTSGGSPALHRPARLWQPWKPERGQTNSRRHPATETARCAVANHQPPPAPPDPPPCPVPVPSRCLWHRIQALIAPRFPSEPPLHHRAQTGTESGRVGAEPGSGAVPPSPPPGILGMMLKNNPPTHPAAPTHPPHRHSTARHRDHGGTPTPRPGEHRKTQTLPEPRDTPGTGWGRRRSTAQCGTERRHDGPQQV